MIENELNLTHTSFTRYSLKKDSCVSDQKLKTSGLCGSNQRVFSHSNFNEPLSFSRKFSVPPYPLSSTVLSHLRDVIEERYDSSNKAPEEWYSISSNAMKNGRMPTALFFIPR